jgi:adenine-specific DNA-methyltransferase
MASPLEKFQGLLKELFQFEQADLDFGVYRIMNLRRDRMRKWLNEELPARARAILAQGGATADDDLGSRLDAVKAQLLELEPGGVDEDGNITKDFLKESAKGKEYLKLKAQHDRAPARTAASMEPLVYNYLYDFFSRYYDTGDFIPKRRRSFAPDGRDTYAIPWDGEEVVLHWANKDQYYIKTGERFTHYRWQAEAGGRMFTVEFRLTDADLPANNNKDANKKFNLLVADKVDWQEDKSTLIVPFHYRGLMPEEEGQLIGTQEAKLRESIIKRTVDTLREHPTVSGVPQLATALMAPKRDAGGQEKRDKDGNAVPLLPHHLNRWAVKNESDFFIHKDLRRFLSGELDYFLKSVVLNLDNLLAAGEQRAEPNYRLLDAVKRLGTEIIDFVSQLEEFQKSLFEKKKFVLETSWCLTLDRISASLKEEVYAAILANDRQWEEWETLYKISQWPADLATVAPRTREFLNAYPHLMLDTGLRDRSGNEVYRHELVERILAGLENIHAHTDGTIIHSENFQALGLLGSAYKGAVSAIYLDPPYNTPFSRIAYKNQFEHSSWLALFANGISYLPNLFADGTSLGIAIDDYEAVKLMAFIDSWGPEGERNVVVVNHHPQGTPGILSRTHEYFVTVTDPRFGFLKGEPLDDSTELRGFMRSGTADNNWRRPRAGGQGRWRSFYAILVNEASNEVVGIEPPPPLDSPYPIDPAGPGIKRVYPINSSGEERVWRNAYETGKRLIEEKKILCTNGGTIKQKIRHTEKRQTLFSNWTDSKYNAGTHGTNLLSAMGLGGMFDYPKSLWTVVDGLWALTFGEEDALVLDYFGGSGTTGHAIIELNRTDGGNRKYLLVDMATYFDTALKPRLQKAVFAEKWSAGVPERQAEPKDANDPYNGCSHCIKVLRLESYEDALDNIEFNAAVAPGEELGLEFRRDYELRYALDWESRNCPTRLAVDQLDTPFDYTLTLRRESGTVSVKPDLPETFAYLIGLNTRRRFRTERDGVSYLIYTGTLNEDGTEVAVLWRTCRGWTENNLKAEMDWWREQRETLAPGATRVYVNGASAIEGHYSLDAEFKNRMHGVTT